MAASDGCVLVVDDEALIALFLSDTLEELGYRVCGTAATADRAGSGDAKTGATERRPS